MMLRGCRGVITPYDFQVPSILFLMIVTRTDITCQEREFSNTARWLAICFGALILLLLGWILDSTAFNGFGPSLASMMPSTTLTLILSGAALVMTVSIIVMRWTATSPNRADRVDRQHRTAERTRDLY